MDELMNSYYEPKDKGIPQSLTQEDCDLLLESIMGGLN